MVLNYLKWIWKIRKSNYFLKNKNKVFVCLFLIMVRVCFCDIWVFFVGSGGGIIVFFFVIFNGVGVFRVFGCGGGGFCGGVVGGVGVLVFIGFVLIFVICCIREK